MIGSVAVRGRELDVDSEREMERVDVGGRDWVAVIGCVSDIVCVAPV